MTHRILRTTQIAFAAALLLSTLAALAGGPEGSIESVDGRLREAIQRALAREGFQGQFEQTAMAYLSKNKSRLPSPDLKREDEINTIVCMLIRDGNAQLKEFGNSTAFQNWCKQMRLLPR